MEKCWWCGDIANTREHKIKRTLVKDLMFNDDSVKKVYLTQRNEATGRAEKKIIQSPDSDFVKHHKNLCQSCNTSKSKKFDEAYRVFHEYLTSNEKSIASSLKIDMNLLNIKQEDLFRYFIKSFCCMIDSTKYTNKPPLSVPLELIAALNGKDYNKSLVIQFFTSNDPIKFPLKKIINVVDPIHSSGSDGTYRFHYFESFGWLDILYFYQTVNQNSDYKKVLRKVAPNYWIGKNRHIIIDRLTDEIIQALLP
jgi:hypothetical protein